MPVLRVFADEKLVDQFDVTSESISIGRNPDNDLVLNSKGVSKHHAVIEKKGPNYFLIDSGSSNGTYIGNQRVAKARLAFWDDIRIAEFVLKFMGNQRHLQQDEDPFDDELGGNDADRTMVLEPGKISKLLEPKRKVVKPVFLPVSHDHTIEVRYEMDKPDAYIGKASDCDIRVGSFWSPRKAARLTWQRDGVFVERMSFRSVMVNRKKVRKKVQLQNGDRLTVNSVEMEFQHITD